MVTSMCPSPDMLADYALGRLSEPDLAGIASHVETCSTCQRQLETLDGLSDTVVACLRRSIADAADSNDALLQEVIGRIAPLVSVSGSAAHDPRAREPALPVQIGQYRLVEKLGQGGMGTVYKAVHDKLKRTVAVKLLPAHRQRSAEAVSRFHREMEAVGRVDHPNIVRAHDAGEADGQFFLVMEFVDGITLSSLVRRRGPLTVADACEIVRQAAVGLQHAHEHGLVHRDVKPSNLMLAAAGVVKVLDLGLARLQVEACTDPDATGSSQIVGTADYMAPEQGVSPREADARADVYSLGCTLYCLLAGLPPFGAPRYATPVSKAMAHAHEPVAPIDRIRPDVPGRLAAVLDHMLAKSPADRFPTAVEVAEQLASFCAGSDIAGLLTDREPREPIGPTVSCRVNTFSRDTLLQSRRSLSRNTVSIATVLSTYKAALMGLAAVLLAVAGLWFGLSRLSTRSAARIRSPERSRNGAELAYLPIDQHAVALEGQADVSPGGPTPAQGEQADTTLQQVHPTVVGVAPNQRVGFPNILATVFDNDVPRFAIAGATRPAEVLNITRLFLCREDDVPMREANMMELRQVNLWVPVRGGPFAQAIPDVGAGTPGHFRPSRSLPDGVYCLHTGTLANSEAPPAFCSPFVVRGYGVPRVERVGVTHEGTNVKLDVIVHNEGSGEFNDGLFIVTLQKKGARRSTFKDRRNLGMEPIPANEQTNVETTWETADWEPGTYYFYGHINYKHLWDANELARFQSDTFSVGLPEGPAEPSPKPAAALESDSTYASMYPRPQSSNDGPSPEPRDRETAMLIHTTQSLEAVRFSPDGRKVAAAGSGQAAGIFDAETGQEVAQLRGHTSRLIEDIAFSPDGSRVATAGWDQTARIWDASDGREIFTLDHAADVESVCFSPDSRYLATACKDGTAKVWNAASGEEVLAVNAHTFRVVSLCFSPDGTRLATGSMDGSAKIWDAATGKQLLVLRHQHRLPSELRVEVSAIHFGPDGARLATANGFNRTATIWDASTGAPLLTFEGHENFVKGACFSPDGSRIATAGSDNTARLWDAATARQLAVFYGNGRMVRGVCFDPDGKRLAAACDDGTVMIWELGPPAGG